MCPSYCCPTWQSECRLRCFSVSLRRKSRQPGVLARAGSPDVRREFRRRSDYAGFVTQLHYNRPRPIFFTMVWFSSLLSTPTPPLPHRALPSLRRPTSSSGLLPSSTAAGGLTGSADRPPSLPSTARALVFFGLWCLCRWCGSDSIGGGDCARGFVHRRLRFISFHLLRSRFKVLPWCSNPKSNVPFVLPLFFLPLYSSISLVWTCVVI